MKGWRSVLPKEIRFHIQEEEFMLGCSQKKRKRKKKAINNNLYAYLFVDYSITFSRSYDIIKTIPGHIRSHQPKSTISGTLSLP